MGSGRSEADLVYTLLQDHHVIEAQIQESPAQEIAANLESIDFATWLEAHIILHHGLAASCTDNRFLGRLLISALVPCKQS